MYNIKILPRIQGLARYEYIPISKIRSSESAKYFRRV